MSDIGEYEEMQYTRVIVIADGVDNEALGYTDDELYQRIEDTRVPIYTIGCAADGNEENLKKMFSLSRMSNGKDYLLSETSGTDILQDIKNDTQVSKITVVPPEKACDGSQQMVRLTYGEDYAAVAVTMPFQAAAPSASSQVESSVLTSQPEVSEPEVVSEPEELPAESSSFALPIPVLIGAFVVLAAAAVVAVIVILKKTKVKDGEPSIDISAIGRSNQTMAMGGKSGTEILNRPEDSKGKTAVIMDTHSVKLCLQDVSDSSRTFEYPLRDKVIIGKDPARCQITIDYDKYVSAVHCQVISRGTEYYVQDGAEKQQPSTNGTFVNEQRVSPELPLPSGAVLKLGQVSFRVSYK